jgi:hypothetical protein
MIHSKNLKKEEENPPTKSSLPTKLSFRNEEQNNILPGKQNLKEVIILLDPPDKNKQQQQKQKTKHSSLSCPKIVTTLFHPKHHFRLCLKSQI